MSPKFCFTVTNKFWLYTSEVSREENQWGRFVSADIPQHPHLIRLGISRTSMDTVLSLQGVGWQHGQSQETYGTGRRLHHELNTKNIDMTVTWLFSFQSPNDYGSKRLTRLIPDPPHVKVQPQKQSHWRAFRYLLLSQPSAYRPSKGLLVSLWARGPTTVPLAVALSDVLLPDVSDRSNANDMEADPQKAHFSPKTHSRFEVGYGHRIFWQSNHNHTE